MKISGSYRQKRGIANGVRCFTLVAVLLGCTAGASAEEVQGIWKSSEYSRNGKELPEMEGKAVYEFRAGGTYVHKMGPWTTAKGTYSIFKDKVLLTSDIGMKTEIRREEGKLVMDNKQSNLRIVYEKSDE
jgi:hypothetical protein